MAEAFLGLNMLVTLSSPPDAQLRGKVSSIVAGQSLTLRDGMHWSHTNIMSCRQVVLSTSSCDASYTSQEMRVP